MQKNLMKNNDINSEEFQEFLKYNKAMFEYEKRADTLSNSNTITEERGYLVYYDDFMELKKMLNYDLNKFYLKRNKESSIYSSFKFEQIKKLEPIEIKSVAYIKDIIINIKCVLVTKELFDLIINKSKNAISFLVDKEYLTLNLKYQEKLELKHNKLILDNIDFDLNEPVSEINIIYNSMLKYFIYDNNMINELNKSIKKSGHGNLVTKKWIDEWKKYTNYEFIKNKYFFENSNIEKNKNFIYKEIINFK